MTFLIFVASEILISATIMKPGHTVYDAVFVISKGKLVSVGSKRYFLKNLVSWGSATWMIAFTSAHRV